ncbi:MAG: UvrD-helicase domain-containing protein [Oscillospiraceae bacterium]|nr:UvrD-helicase domain-containing protein [Oscillospiraceae bacterium]
MAFSYDSLNPRQMEAVLHKDGPLLVLAGAGSGKTTVLIARVARLIETGVRPWNILTITVTNKAADELKNRLVTRLGMEAADVFASTFHSMCVRILRRDAELIDLPKSFTIYDTDDSLRVVKKCLKTLNMEEKQFPPKPLLGAISHAKERLEDPQNMANLAERNGDYRMKVTARVYAAYQKELHEAGALDFDDLLCETVRLFKTHPEVLEYYQNRWQYIMVDEYQDTNHVQYMLVAMLAAKNKNLCVVGDDDQSIYKFRGATIENILSFERQFPGAKVVRLEQNYRSTQNILSAANEVIAHNTERKGKNLWTSNGEGSRITVRRCIDEDREAEFIVDKVVDGLGKGANYSDFAVLYRMHAQSASLERAFMRAGVPYKIIGGLRFYERKEIKDMLAYMSVIANPADNLRLERIINEPKRGIGATTLAAAQHIADVTGMPLFDIFEHADEYIDLMKRSAVLMGFTKMIRELAELAEDFDAEQFFDALCEKTGYTEMLRAQGLEGETRLENVGELKTNMMKYQDAADNAELSGFLEEVALYTDLDRMEESDSVLMMTLHSAKGLEFENVFIIGVEEGVFPGMQAIYDMTEMEEERRLAYVGITRAKKNLFLTAAASRMIFGQTSHNRLSRFAEEIPEEYKDFHDESESRRRNISYHFEEEPGGKVRIEKTYSEAPKTEGTNYRPGDTVSHRVFGKGTVLSASPMSGDTLLEIAFEKVGTKKLMANFAKMKKE